MSLCTHGNPLRELLSHVLNLAADLFNEAFPPQHLFDLEAVFVRVGFDGAYGGDEVGEVFGEGGERGFEVGARGGQLRGGAAGSAAGAGGGEGEGADSQVGGEEGAGAGELCEDVAGGVSMAG